MPNYYCDVCDKTVKYKKKHLNNIFHKHLSKPIINKYNVLNPDFLKIDKIFKKYVLDYNKKFFFRYQSWMGISFDGDIVFERSKKLTNCVSNLPFLRMFLMSQKVYYENKGYNF